MAINPLLQLDGDVEVINKQPIDNDIQFLMSPNGVNNCCNPNVIRCAAQYNDLSEGMKLLIFLERMSETQIAGNNCLITINQVSYTDWSETLLSNISGVEQPDGTFTADITKAQLNNLELDGELILAVTITLSRLRKTYRKKFYINHLGIFDTTERLRKRINTHEIVYHE